MKVIHLNTYTTGGAATAVKRLNNALAKTGVESKILNLDDFPNALKSPSQKARNFFEKTEWRLEKYANIYLSTRKRIINQYNTALSTIQCEMSTLPFSYINPADYEHRIKDADIIHLHWIAGMIDYKKFFRNLNKPIVWTLHDKNPFMGMYHYKNDAIVNQKITCKIDQEIENIKAKAIQSMNSTITLVSPSKSLMKEAKSSKTFNSLYHTCIPNTIDLDLFRPQKDAQFKLKNGISPGNRVFIFLAQNVKDRWKGFDLFYKALYSLRHLPVTVLVIGSSESILIDELDCRKLGVIHQPQKLVHFLSNADALILPSREDNLPNVMLESIACGTPVISFKIGGMIDHVKNFKTGLLAEEMTSESLSSAIQLFMKNEHKFDREYIRRYAENHFNEKLISSKYIEVYEDLLIRAQ